jgi:hypothetical protein
MPHQRLVSIKLHRHQVHHTSRFNSRYRLGSLEMRNVAAWCGGRGVMSHQTRKGRLGENFERFVRLRIFELRKKGKEDMILLHRFIFHDIKTIEFQRRIPLFPTSEGSRYSLCNVFADKTCVFPPVQDAIHSSTPPNTIYVCLDGPQWRAHCVEERKYGALEGSSASVERANATRLHFAMRLLLGFALFALSSSTQE